MSPSKAEKVAATSQRIGDTIGDYIASLAPDIIAALDGADEEQAKLGKAGAEALVSALSWPGLADMPNQEALAGMRAQAWQMAELAVRRFGRDKFVELEAMSGLSHVARRQMMQVARDLKGNVPVGDMPARTLATANVVIALGNDSPWFAAAKNTLVSEMGIADRAPAKKVKAPAL